MYKECIHVKVAFVQNVCIDTFHIIIIVELFFILKFHLFFKCFRVHRDIILM